MTARDHRLPSWRPGAARDEILSFLARSAEIPPEDRVACFDNDGTLWCERPRYLQLEFLLDALRQRVATEPDLASVPEFAALVTQDAAAMHDLGLPRIAMALVRLFDGMSADRFRTLVRTYMAVAEHPTFRRPLRTCVYQPMLELIAELKQSGFSVAIVTGGGTEFVRAVSQDLYGVAPENVVGTLIEYDYASEDGRPVLIRTNRLSGTLNDGPEKVAHIQAQLGRRPVFAAGNTTGDREMLTWAETAEGPSLALVVDHDDEAREFAYPGTGEAATGAPLLEVGQSRGWTVASMARDWAEIFPAVPDGALRRVE